MFKKYILEITVFVCGAVVMVFELVGSRVLAPFFGNSISVWTALIGIILGSLSLGYYLGGKIADKKQSIKTLSLIILGSAMCIYFTVLIKDILILFLSEAIIDTRTSAVIASVILFAPASILLGMVSPYSVKLKLNNLQTSGSAVGNLYAISTVGSIFGTFLAGFYLIPSFGTFRILVLLAIVLFFLFFLLQAENFLHAGTQRKAFLVILLISGLVAIWSFSEMSLASQKIIDLDTAYNRVWIYEYEDSETGRTAREMLIGNERSSAMFLDNSSALVYEYTKYYDLAWHFNPSLNNALILGGAGYSYPKYFLDKYSDKTIDVVEIDPKLTEIAKKYFDLKDNPRMNIFHEDGRTFLNSAKKKYDAIFGDAFNSQFSIPYQLTTKEAVKKTYDTLNNEGVVIANLICSVEGAKSEFLRAEYRTYKTIFPQVYIFPVMYPNDGEKVQNIMLVAIKSNKKSDFTSKDPELSNYLRHLWQKEIKLDMPVLTDDFAPVDYYINKAI